MTISEKAAYIKGLADGLKLDVNTAEGKVISELLNLVSDMADELADIREDATQLRDYVEELDDDLALVEEDLYDDGEFEDEDEPAFFEATCPTCGETICFDDSIDPEDVACPNCGERFDCSGCECDGECEGCAGCGDDSADAE